jgi:hypothetical protein
LQVDAPGLMRGAASRITVAAQAQYTAGPADERQSAALSAFTPTLALVGPTGEFALKPKDGLTRSGDGLTAEYEIPKVPDGQYVLRATVVSSLGTSTLELPTPLFTPARLHVLTDRPLYEPGNLVRFRAVALKASDLTPLDGRPGRWLVRDPTNEVVLEELAPAGPWGVVAGSFPLDRTAEIGTWRVSWSSGGVEESRDFLVKPFTLPRFQIEATPAKPFYQKHQRPLLEGRVRYASGAPVARAKLELSWRVSGTWPPPTGWVDGSALPKSAVTSASGAFSVELPEVRRTFSSRPSSRRPSPPWTSRETASRAAPASCCPKMPSP